MNWHLLSAEETGKVLESGNRGISISESKRKLAEYGRNEVEEGKKKTPAVIFLHQITDFMVVVLIIASVISGFIGDLTDTIIILAIVVLNTVVGFIQEYRAEKAIEALKKMSATMARVIREGKIFEINSTEIVPGDLVMLEAGNVVPADIRLNESVNLKINESTLTGESNDILKITATLHEGSYVIGDRVNMAYKGTHVTYGRGTGYAVATGMNTELGLIARMIQGEGTMTPLQKRLADFGKKLSAAIFFICGVIFTLGILRGEEVFNLLLTAISLAVAAIPEALPAVVTIALAIGAKRMVKQNALIRKLPAVETLGSVTYICSDKTGTLTKNKMEVTEAVEVNHEIKFTSVEREELFGICIALNNDAAYSGEGRLLGDSTEVALAEHATAKGFIRSECEERYPRIGEVAFDSLRKKMTTLHRAGNEYFSITKGAAEAILECTCSSQAIHADLWKKDVELMSAKGLRVLGFAVKQYDEQPETMDAADVETSLSFIGYAGMIDPARDEVADAVALCKGAGIIPVMITGDHPATAEAIARQIGIIRGKDDKLLTGVELDELDQEEFENRVLQTKVYARVSPEQKLKIVTALQDKGQFVAMTGDGVNDAPALKNADIGVAMGINGTEVAKEASDMILLDDNFATIVNAVGSGRRVYDNILKFIKYVMTGNSGEIWTMFLAPFFGLPVPLLPIHILWVNLVTDGLPGLALASEPAEKDIMKRNPRNPGENIFSQGMAYHIMWVGLLIGFLCIGTQAVYFTDENTHWQTMVFTVLCFCQIAHVLAIRSGNVSLFKAGILSNTPLLLAALLTVGLQMMIIYIPVLNNFFKTQPLTVSELGITLGVSALVFVFVEIEKIFKRRKHANNEVR